ncbi:MAG TPA: hypothetical protein VJH68_04450 [Candidatus Nanoarchaeia archaeon]|nr:hypothetical protein [Candidatus Nanoarchaeia archaeon]
MVNDPWYRDRKFNSALQPDGSFNFAGFFSRPTYAEPENPLAVILDGFNKNRLVNQIDEPVGKIKAPCGMYVSSIQRLTSSHAGRLAVISFCLKFEQPQPVNQPGGNIYHGYLVKVDAPSTVRRYQEIQDRGTWRIQAFGVEKSFSPNKSLEDLLSQMNSKKINVRDRISKDLASQLYSLWPIRKD